MTPFELQTALAAEDCYHGVIDGIAGPQTIGAIKQFQAEHGLAQTGIVDADTLRVLDLQLHSVPGVPLVALNAATLIAAWESVGDGNPNTAVLEAYFDDAGVATLAFGHAILDETGQQIRAAIKGDPAAKARADAAVTRLYGRAWVTLAEAKSLLSIDINQRVSQIAPLLRGAPTSQAQFDAMVALAINIGVTGFSKSTVLTRHRAGASVSRNINTALERLFATQGKMDGTMEGAFTAWCHAGGEFMLGLFRRHLCEAMVYRGDDMGVAIATARAVS